LSLILFFFLNAYCEYVEKKIEKNINIQINGIINHSITKFIDELKYIFKNFSCAKSKSPVVIPIFAKPILLAILELRE
jgi:hypothetical protein